MHVFTFVIATFELVDIGPSYFQMFLWLVAAGVLRTIFAGGKRDTEPRRASTVPSPAPEPQFAHSRPDYLNAPNQVISLVGRTSSGKSSLGNALLGQEAFPVGVEHGTTYQTHAVAFRGNYQLQDTPGLLDGEHYSAAVLDAAKKSELVILLTTGQLYRQELDFLRNLCSVQITWNRTRKPTEPPRSTLVFLNAADLKECTMPSSERVAEIAAVKVQVAPWVPPESVLSGAAAPLDGSPPWIASLSGYLTRFCQESAALTTA